MWWRHRHIPNNGTWEKVIASVTAYLVLHTLQDYTFEEAADNIAAPTYPQKGRRSPTLL